jgi:50S ribosomal protein L16 3-hydroxylase
LPADIGIRDVTASVSYKAGMPPLSKLSRWFEAFDLSASQMSFGTAPYAQASTAQRLIPLLTWDVLVRVLGTSPSSDVLTVTAGRLIEAPTPRSQREVEALMTAGVSVVVRRAEAQDDALAELARAFETTFGGEVHVQLYATPAGTNSFGWHYDFEDVFIAQTFGSKDYFFRANTTARSQVLGEPLDFTPFAKETSPLHTARLLAGDWLYLPACWWHLVRYVEDSLSISVGSCPPSRSRGRNAYRPAGLAGPCP